MALIACAVITLLTTFGLLVGRSATAATTSEAVSTEFSKNFLNFPFGATNLLLGLVSVGAAAYVLSRAAFIELEISTRLNGMADALCLAGADSAELERIAGILVPKSKYFSLSSPEFSKELNAVLDIVRKPPTL